MDDHCREVLQNLHTYLDGECGNDLEDAIRTHLGDCGGCLDRAGFERELRRVVATTCREHAPVGLLDRILEDLRAPE